LGSRSSIVSEFFFPTKQIIEEESTKPEENSIKEVKNDIPLPLEESSSEELDLDEILAQEDPLYKENEEKEAIEGEKLPDGESMKKEVEESVGIIEDGGDKPRKDSGTEEEEENEKEIMIT